MYCMGSPESQLWLCDWASFPISLGLRVGITKVGNSQGQGWMECRDPCKALANKQRRVKMTVPCTVPAEFGTTGCCFWTREARAGLISTKTAGSSLSPICLVAWEHLGLQRTAGSRLMFADSELQAWAWLCLPSTDGLKTCHPNWPRVNQKDYRKKIGVG